MEKYHSLTMDVPAAQEVDSIITTNFNSGMLSPTSSTSSSTSSPAATLSRYENQKRRDWNTFGQYLRNHRPPLALSRCSGAHVLEFLRYLFFLMAVNSRIRPDTRSRQGIRDPSGHLTNPLRP